MEEQPKIVDVLELNDHHISVYELKNKKVVDVDAANDLLQKFGVDYKIKTPNKYISLIKWAADMAKKQPDSAITLQLAAYTVKSHILGCAHKMAEDAKTQKGLIILMAEKDKESVMLAVVSSNHSDQFKSELVLKTWEFPTVGEAVKLSHKAAEIIKKHEVSDVEQIVSIINSLIEHKEPDLMTAGDKRMKIIKLKQKVLDHELQLEKLNKSRLHHAEHIKQLNEEITKIEASLNVK